MKADVFVQEQKLEVVHELKYLGLLLDSQLSFKKHVKNVVGLNIAKFNLANFRFIRNSLTNEAAVLFKNSMIIPHITYCMTTWTQTCRSFLKPVESIYKQTLKVLDKIPNSFHHCSILTKFSILSWEHLIQFSDLVLIFKILNGFAPPVFKDYIHQITGYARAGIRGDCNVPLRRTTFGQLSFAFRGTHEWNRLPVVLTELKHLTGHCGFSKKLKIWLLTHQNCDNL